jgi:LEA14-like dessication related protein
VNPKIIVGAVVAAFVIIIGLFGFSGTSIIDDVSGRGIVSSSEAPIETLPIKIELENISILDVNEKAALIEVQFKVTNPNYKSIILQTIKYDLYENNMKIKSSQIGERPMGMVDSSNYFTLLSEKPTILKETITIKNTGNTPEFWNALTNNTPQWKIKGEASFNLSSITAGGENEITFEFP